MSGNKTGCADQCVSFLRSIRAIHNDWLRETETILVDLEERLFQLPGGDVEGREEARAEVSLSLAQAREKRHALVAREYSALTEAIRCVHSEAELSASGEGIDEDVGGGAGDEVRRALDCEFRLLRKVRRHIISQIEARASEPASDAREAALNTLDRDLNIVQKELKAVRARRQALGMTLGDYSIGPAAGSEEADGLERLLKKVMEGVSPVKKRQDADIDADEPRIDSFTPVRPMAMSGQENPSAASKGPSTAIAVSPSPRVALPLRQRK